MLQMLVCCGVGLVGVPLPQAGTAVGGYRVVIGLCGILVIVLISVVSYPFHVIETSSGDSLCFPIIL